MIRTLIFALSSVLAIAPAVGGPPKYLAEHVYDTSIGPDELLTNVSLVNHRWPDCSTLESTVEDIFRLEGVADRKAATDQQRALALWKWFRILVSSTGGGYMQEGPADRPSYCRDPHKILTVYGHHQCDGLSWAMAPLWRAAGYMAFDECTHGHTTANLRYRDADGAMRYHSFDPQARYYWWDADRKRVATRSLPVMTGMVHRHVIQPRRLHSLPTGLRDGEMIERNWDNSGNVIVAGRLTKPIHPKYYAHKPGRTKGVYAVAGEQVQTLEVNLGGNPLAAGSFNTGFTENIIRGARFHPARSGQDAFFVYRLGPPYVVVEADLAATLLTRRPDDLCRIDISRDGRTWMRVFEKTRVGRETVRVDFGRAARLTGRPDVFTAYDVYVRIHLKTAGRAGHAGFDTLRITTRREFNKRTQPNLMPGENVFRVAGGEMPAGRVLLLDVAYEFKGRRKADVHHIGRLPYYFRIDVPGWELRKIGNYDQDFANEAARMIGYRLQLTDVSSCQSASRSLPVGKAAAKFTEAHPHPADMTRTRKPRKLETDPMQTSGFFPQSRVRKQPDERMAELIAQLKAAGDSSYKAWHAAQQLGDYPVAVDALHERLKTSNIDLTLFICKALARIADPRSVDPLLARWDRVPAGSPGTRYIPDCLAAIGDRRAVRPLIAKLPHVRFDFRFHIAHALGKLGGPEAQAALKHLAEHDPFPAVREIAGEGLAKPR